MRMMKKSTFPSSRKPTLLEEFFSNWTVMFQKLLLLQKVQSLSPKSQNHQVSQNLLPLDLPPFCGLQVKYGNWLLSYFSIRDFQVLMLVLERKLNIYFRLIRKRTVIKLQRWLCSWTKDRTLQWRGSRTPGCCRPSQTTRSWPSS